MSIRNSEEYYIAKKNVLRRADCHCEITGKFGNVQVHHIKPVNKFPQLACDENNMIVMDRNLHMKFHLRYGNNYSIDDWNGFIEEVKANNGRFIA